MGLKFLEVHVRALKKLEGSSFQRFIERLSAWKVREGYKNIPKDEMMGKDPEHLAGLIYRYYRYAYGAEVTLDVLEDIDEKKVREELQQDLREVDVAGHGLGTVMFTDSVTFVDSHQSALIIWIENVASTLSELQTLRLLTWDQYMQVMRQGTTKEQMADLCDIISDWDDTGKYTANIVLRRWHDKYIQHVEHEERMRRYREPQPIRDMVNVIDSHRSDLIRRITDVDPVLRDLRDQELLTEEQYNVVMSGRTSQEKMTELCDIIRHWEETETCTAYTTLRKYNEEIIKDLETEDKLWRNTQLWRLQEHFVDRHRSHLSNNIKEVNPVLDDLRSNHLLAEEDYTRLQAMTTPEEKMRHLFHIFYNESNKRKDPFYISLWRFNYTVINNLEKLEKSGKIPEAGDHFIDKYRQDLICRIIDIRPIVNELFRNELLTKNGRDDIIKETVPEERRRRLYAYIRDWNDYDKDEVCRILHMHNPTVIDDLKMLEGASKLKEETSQESESFPRGNAGVKEDDLSCKLCDKPQDSAEVLTPTVVGSTFRLSIPSPGLFRCSESGIQFQVTQPVTIEYEVDSWSNYTEILQNLRGGYQIIGPLFNIRSRLEPNVVSAVYLPHCLCLGGYKEDKSLIRCFHYKDDNLVLEAPSRMEAMYAVLENPTFSCIGVLLYPLTLIKEGIIKLIPYHGMVLLFCNTITREDLTHKYRLHLYLLPKILTVAKVVELYETRFSFQRIHKPPQTEFVYSKTKYRIHGPQVAHVFPKTLQFESHCPSEIYPFIEININGEKNTEVVVSILPEDRDVTVWETVVTAEEMLDLPSAMSKLTIQPGDSWPLPLQSDHFVDKHRADLIRMISVVDLVLDDLLALKLLTYNQYKTVLIPSTNAEQMRKLYDYVRAWGNDDKDKVYQTLKRHNYPIIRQLEGEVPEAHNEAHTVSHTKKCNLY